MKLRYLSSLTKILIVFGICLGSFSKAYSQKVYDSIFKKANIIIYENPDKAIEMGLEIYRASNSSLEQKANAVILISTGYSSKRNYEKSLEYANKALALLPKIQNDVFKITTLNKLGSQYQQLKVYDKALSYLDNALEIANNHKNKDSIAKLLGYNFGVRGFIYREQMSCEIALRYFNKSLFYFHERLKFDPIMNSNISIIEYNKGNCFIQSKKIDSAKISFNNAINFAQANSAKSLEAFAKKGLAEVYTSQGHYKDAITILNDAQIISSSVGDLILNQSIYNGLQNTYLAVGDRRNFEFYKTKYDQTILEIKTNEVTTVNTSLKQLFEENENELEYLTSKINFYKLITLILLLAFLSIMVKMLFSYKKNSINLKMKLKNQKIEQDIL